MPYLGCIERLTLEYFLIRERSETSLRDWLNYKQSITQRLALKLGDAKVDVLAQGFEDCESTLSHSTRIWRREVVIRSHGLVYWYARTLVPELTFTMCEDFFSQLQEKSLGEFIFKTPSVECKGLIHYPVSKVSQLYQWLPKDLKPKTDRVLWVRTASYLLKKQYDFSLCEIYLPNLLRCCE
jgi:chorismate--pyruvate lyase